jgi:anti-sigma B factor antagonist
LERALDSLLKQGRFFIIVDLGNVDYISSAGWGIFISEIKSIRENGGDLKLVRMVPDVYEIFELLEFHHILDVYDAVDEAVNKFEMLQASGKPVAKEITLPKPEEEAPVETPQPMATPAEASVRTESVEQQQMSATELSVEDKIKLIIKENPSFGAFKIKKELNSSKFGYTKIGWFQVRSLLAQLNLNSRSRRYQFATGK